MKIEMNSLTKRLDKVLQWFKLFAVDELEFKHEIDEMLQHVQRESI